MNDNRPSSLKDKTARGLFWGGLSNGMQQLLNLLFGIVLARLLSQSDYGMVGMLTIFSAIAAALQEGGFISALTNKKHATHRDYNAVFWFSLSCSLVLYALLYACAPLIARFYGTPELTPLARLSFLGFVVSSLSIAPRAYLFKNLRNKETTLISLLSLIVSGTTGIVLAWQGFAYWGIALQSITFVLCVTVLNFYFSRWRPTLSFSLQPIRQMIGFSSKLIVTNVCTIINLNLFSMLLGKFYTAREVGDFAQANKWNTMGHTFISGMINGVAQPVLTRLNDEPARQTAAFRKLLRFTAFVSFPALFGLSLVSRELIVLTITDKWIESARILQLLCVGGAFVPIGLLFSNLLISRGHSSVYMWSTLSQSVVQLAVACMAYPYGIGCMLYGFVAVQIGWLLVWQWFVRREIGLTYTHALCDLGPYLLLSAVLTTGTHWACRGIDTLWASLLLKVFTVATLYVGVLWMFRSVILRESIAFFLKKQMK